MKHADMVNARAELVEMELIRDSGKRRPDRSGKQAIVWQAVPEDELTDEAKMWRAFMEAGL